MTFSIPRLAIFFFSCSGGKTLGPFLSRFRFLPGAGVRGVRSAGDAARRRRAVGRFPSEDVRADAARRRRAHARDRHHAQGRYLYGRHG